MLKPGINKRSQSYQSREMNVFSLCLAFLSDPTCSLSVSDLLRCVHCFSVLQQLHGCLVQTREKLIVLKPASMAVRSNGWNLEKETEDAG